MYDIQKFECKTIKPTGTSTEAFCCFRSPGVKVSEGLACGRGLGFADQRSRSGDGNDRIQIVGVRVPEAAPRTPARGIGSCPFAAVAAAAIPATTSAAGATATTTTAATTVAATATGISCGCWCDRSGFASLRWMINGG